MIKALLIDDDLKLAKLLENYLSKFTITLTSISDSLQAMDAIKDQKPEVIILDVMMPGINGFDVCRLIRKKHSVPIIMLSARGEPNDKIKGLELGADDYIAKPFEPRELVARITSLIRRVPDKRNLEDSHIVPWPISFPLTLLNKLLPLDYLDSSLELITLDYSLSL